MNELMNTIKDMDKIELTAEERRRIWSSINTRISQNPNIFNTKVRKGVPSRQYLGGWFALGNSFFTTHGAKYSIIAALALVLVLGGSLSAFAQSALPGDALYPIKVGINEKVREIIAVTAKSKAELEVDLAVLRLDEARQLAEKGKLNSALAEESEARFVEHTHRLENNISDLETDGQFASVVATSKKFEGKLQNYQKSLEDLRGSSSKELKGEANANAAISTTTENEDSTSTVEEDAGEDYINHIEKTLPLYVKTSETIRENAEKELMKDEGKKEEKNTSDSAQESED